MSLSPFRTLAVSAAACAAAVSLTGCGAVLNGVLGAAGGEADIFQIEVGDCFIGADMATSLADTEVSEVPTVDCAEEHDSEVYHIEVLPEGDFPGTASIEASATEVCESKFEEFVGISYLESEIYYSTFTPLEEGWNTIDDREIVCYLVTNGEMVTGSLAGAAR
jgi:hypothetical protein